MLVFANLFKLAAAKRNLKEQEGAWNSEKRRLEDQWSKQLAAAQNEMKGQHDAWAEEKKGLLQDLKTQAHEAEQVQTALHEQIAALKRKMDAEVSDLTELNASLQAKVTSLQVLFSFLRRKSI